MARKRVTAVRLAEGAPRTGWQLTQIERVTWIEDGKTFPQEQAREQVARAVNAGEAFYLRTPDGAEVRLRAQLRHGTYYLAAPGAADQPDHLLALPALGG